MIPLATKMSGLTPIQIVILIGMAMPQFITHLIRFRI